jgi:hypothetical protein
MVEPEKVRELARKLPFTKELERDVWVALNKFEMFIGTVKIQGIDDPYVWFFNHADNRFQFQVMCELYKVVFAALTMVTDVNDESVNVLEKEPPDPWQERYDKWIDDKYDPETPAEYSGPDGLEDESAWGFDDTTGS